MSLLIGGTAWLSAPSIALSAPAGVNLIETPCSSRPVGRRTAAAVDRAVSARSVGGGHGLSWVQLQRAYISGGCVESKSRRHQSLDTAAQDEAATLRE
jgi:hypothetical protein